ncbi:uncharacterized protein EI90DRAFT_3287027 [Cantharellus anzutake]|uniref:uncharacterized protein n=1 Tax=Cantharellus anzutake TaxID=1750568 RepID=UPI00190588A3|nr:uncharacterized protein EI90DRAFT_3287027 [Cantharellus anzutake]KAF8337407.1 hypothetical protein EI90DRAFT_3287027 [Cantharellus anzutake]
MPLDTIYISRHGFRLSWVTNDWRSETGLERDPPLAAYGVTQAKQLAAWIASFPEEKKPTAIFCSPFYRTLQTATPIAESLGIPIYVEHALIPEVYLGIAEWYSPAAPGTGLHPRPGTAASLRQYFPLIDTRWRSTWFPSRKGENVREVHDRTADFLRAFFKRLDYSPSSSGNDQGGTESDAGFADHRRILFMGHAATVITLVRELVGNRDLPIRVGCCSLSTLVPRPTVDGTVMPSPNKSNETPRLGEWEVVVKTDAHFLDGGVERDWGFEDIEVDQGEVVDDVGSRDTIGEEEGPSSFGLQVSLPDGTASANSSRL